MNPNINKYSVRFLLDTNVEFLSWAVLTLYNLQTAEEKQVGTFESNKKGFNYADGAGNGKYIGRWLASGKKLSGPFIAKAKRMMMKYAGQLVDILQEESARAAGGYIIQHPSAWRDELEQKEVLQLNMGQVEYNIPDLFPLERVRFHTRFLVVEKPSK